MDKMETERDFCEMLLKEVAKSDLEFAKQLQRESDLKDASSTVEGLRLKDCLPSSKKIRDSWRTWKPSRQPRVKQELKINPIKREPSNPWQIRRFGNNPKFPNAHLVEWNMIFRSVRKKKRDLRKKRNSAENDFLVQKGRSSVEANILKMSKSKKKTTVVALCGLLLDVKAL
jgi:hypothetical protein